ncbi:class I glutamine amidotransferase-like protein [Piedraia hortae CBS 480.64]|uniref:Class I glutamine amidotransferase-like protein n=1 Tax=Piedraia hortae CBS 480.64 TaxID=1314780 RepID=A0A6A7BXV6_9PEZI|nr:class I glutamine amidotransferase-like protein [Piedraia hortae CBS 480.64]
MSAIVEEGHESAPETVKVLVAAFDGMDMLDATGPMEVFSNALHDKNNPDSKAFNITICGPSGKVTTSQGIGIAANTSYDDATKRLGDFDLLVIPGGGTDAIIKSKGQPLPIIKAFAELQKRNPSRERTLMSVCTGSLFLAETGILSGLTATTHPDFMARLEIICSNVAQRDMSDRTDVMDARYVVNNLRFDLGNEEEKNPYIMTKKEYQAHQRRKSATSLSSPIEEGTNGATGTRRQSNARKGSMSFKISNMRRESVLKRAELRLGGLRVLTSSGVTSGVDGALYLVGALVSDDAAEETARKICHEWKKGVVVDGTDV